MLSVKLLGKVLRNPIIIPSGILGTTYGLIKRLSLYGPGAITIKSISLEPREGHDNPTVIPLSNGLLNAVGYSNMGLINALEEFKDLSGVQCPVIASIIGQSLDEFSALACSMSKLDFMAIEVPLSCPHTPGYGLMGNQASEQVVYAITKEVVSCGSKPVIIKLPFTPNVVELAIAAERGGASAVSLVNTIGPSMVIDIDSGKPLLGFKYGGLSGPFLRPVTVGTVYRVFEKISIPIIGIGGISNSNDIVEVMMAGAKAVGIGTSLYLKGLDSLLHTLTTLHAYANDKGIKISDICGVAHVR